jgi:hypothetical protein
MPIYFSAHKQCILHTLILPKTLYPYTQTGFETGSSAPVAVAMSTAPRPQGIISQKLLKGVRCRSFKTNFFLSRQSILKHLQKNFSQNFPSSRTFYLTCCSSWFSTFHLDDLIIKWGRKWNRGATEKDRKNVRKILWQKIFMYTYSTYYYISRSLWFSLLICVLYLV